MANDRCTGERGEQSPTAETLAVIRRAGFVPIRSHTQYYCREDGTILGKRGRPLKGHIDRCGYLEVLLTENFTTRNFLAHRLILSTFLPIPGWETMEVNHKNGNKADNRLANLEWCTRPENIRHAYAMGLERRRTGTSHWAHRLSKEAVTDIRENAITGHRPGNNMKDFAKKYNCDITVIRDVVAGRSYCED